MHFTEKNPLLYFLDEFLPWVIVILGVTWLVLEIYYDMKRWELPERFKRKEQDDVLPEVRERSERTPKS